MMRADKKRIIKKYPNRRLYDTAESKYVTLFDVRKLVLDQVGFCVIDKKSGLDITRNILLQIIVEQEDEAAPFFSTDVLERIIGFYGDSVQEVAGDFLSRSLKQFHEQHLRFRATSGDATQNSPQPPTVNGPSKHRVSGVTQQTASGVFKSPNTTRAPTTDDKK
jgi:polyhydroxyalkanoate synthesis repressor PhaR